MRRLAMAVGNCLALSLAGCGEVDALDHGGASEGIEATTHAIEESNCLIMSKTSDDAVLPYDPYYGTRTFSPTKYDNPGCRKSWVARAAGLFPLGGVVDVWWADPWKRNEAQCTNGSLKVEIMSRTTTFPAPAFYQLVATTSAPLLWDAPQGVCWYPSFEFWATSEGWTGGLWAYNADVPVGTFPPVNPWFVGGLPASVAGRSVRFAAQALTPAGSTQPIKANFH